MRCVRKDLVTDSDPLGTTSASRPTRQRAGGRSELVRANVAEAVLSFMREGKTDLSVAEIAERADVHRSTIYRWWPTPVDLYREALAVRGARFVLADTGSWRGDVSVAMESLAAFLSDPVEVALTAAFAAHNDPEGNLVQIEYWAPILEQLTRVVHRGIGRGELPADTDLGAAALMMVSPISTYALVYRSSPPEALLKSLTQGIIRAFAIDDRN